MSASSTDLSRMAGNPATAGIPNSAELTSGDRTAVRSPTRQPYL